MVYIKGLSALGRRRRRKCNPCQYHDAWAVTDSDRHRIECDFGADGYAAVRIYGWWKGSEWKQVAWYHGPWYPGQLRIALWTHPGIADALGDCSVTIDRCTVTMADAEVAG